VLHAATMPPRPATAPFDHNDPQREPTPLARPQSTNTCCVVGKPFLTSSESLSSRTLCRSARAGGQ
jgi:hypothetical protein